MKPGRDKNRENQLFSRSSFPKLVGQLLHLVLVTSAESKGSGNIIRTMKALPLFSGYWFVSLWVLFFDQLPSLPPCKQPRSQGFSAYCNAWECMVVKATVNQVGKDWLESLFKENKKVSNRTIINVTIHCLGYHFEGKSTLAKTCFA